MKKNLTFCVSALLFMLTLTTSFNANAQQIRATPNPNNPSEFAFQVDNYTPSHNGVVLSHLWWFGDNGYSFLGKPSHTFSDNNQKKPSVVVTEGYGTGGPPPLRLASSINSQLPIPQFRTLAQGSQIRMQNYRKAVAKDTVYFIVTYAQPSGSNAVTSGTVTIQIDNSSTYLDAFQSNNTHFLPNGETVRYSSNAPTEINVDFTNLKNEERSILIPVYIGINQKRSLSFSSSVIFHNISEEQYKDALRLPMRHSQDPNQMSEYSSSSDQNGGDVYTPCEFGGEKIDYTIDFQNVGEGPTHYIQVVCQLDDKVDLNSIRDVIPPSKYASINEVMQPQMPAANEANYYINHTDKTITFEFQDLKLFGTGDPLCQNLNVTKSSVSFTIDAKPNYVFGPPIISYSTIVFDENDPLVTDTVYTSCNNPVSPGGFPSTPPTSPFPIKWILIGAGILVVGLIAIKKLKK